jgi:hypothetical protein
MGAILQMSLAHIIQRLKTKTKKLKEYIFGWELHDQVTEKTEKENLRIK